MTALTLTLRSLNVSRPKPLGLWRGEAVTSAIAKEPVTAAALALTATNLEGDGQADLTVHGGPEKAVYAYHTAHWDWWQTTHNLACAPATFGENLTLDGPDETELHIGDIFAWGTAVLQICQPRQPCFKLQMHTGRADVGARMTLSARCGWYARVLQPGDVPVHGALTRTGHAKDAPTVKATFQALFNPRLPADALRAFAQPPALSQEWRGAFAHRAASRA